MAADQAATLEKIRNKIANNNILLFMKGSPEAPQCGFSAKAVSFLRNVRFGYVNVLDEPDIRQVLPSYANWPTFPQLYIKGELIGGSDIMEELHQNGELQAMLAAAAPAPVAHHHHNGCCDHEH